MTVARRSLLAGGTAGVGLVVAGAVPSLAEAAPAPPSIAAAVPPTLPAVARRPAVVRDRAQPAQRLRVAGPTFSDDGRTLFVSIQTPGITLAITGPWATYLS